MQDSSTTFIQKIFHYIPCKEFSIFLTSYRRFLCCPLTKSKVSRDFEQHSRIDFLTRFDHYTIISHGRGEHYTKIDYLMKKILTHVRFDGYSLTTFMWKILSLSNDRDIGHSIIHSIITRNLVDSSTRFLVRVQKDQSYDLIVVQRSVSYRFF